MIATKDLRMVRGQTLRLAVTVKDHNQARVSLTGATIHLRVRPDPKAAPVITLSSPATGITIAADQVGTTKGDCTATIAPSLTASLPVGDYVYDLWIVDAAADRFPVVAPSRLTILPEVTTIAP